MKRLIAAVAVAAASQFALAPAALATPQQNKMKECNVQAGEKKGDERKAFMKECLSAKKVEQQTAKTAQQQKMKDCNQQAAGKKGDERKAFMSSCLKG